jgi:hypothetical protein
MVDLLRDVLMDSYDVGTPQPPASVAAIDAFAPDVVIVGTADDGRTQHELIADAAGHVRLHDVPFVLMSADPNLLDHAGRLSMFPHVRLVSLPFDLDTIRSVTDAAARASRASTMHAARFTKRAAPCPHGLSSDACRRCR